MMNISIRSYYVAGRYRNDAFANFLTFSELLVKVTGNLRDFGTITYYLYYTSAFVVISHISGVIDYLLLAH